MKQYEQDAEQLRTSVVAGTLPPGSRLPNDLIINQAKLREVESNGMLC